LVLYSYYLEDKTDKEIGENLKIKGDTIRKIRERAKSKVKRKYKNYKEERNV